MCAELLGRPDAEEVAKESRVVTEKYGIEILYICL